MTSALPGAVSDAGGILAVMMPSTALSDLWHRAGGDPLGLRRASVSGNDPVLPTDFQIGTAASALIAATALAATEVWRTRTGRAQAISVDVRAAAAAFRSERYLRVNGQRPADVRGSIFGFYRTADGRWVQLHGAMAHHREGIVGFLGGDPAREALAKRVAAWTAEALEDALAQKGLPAAMVRTPDEWHAHPQGLAVAASPLLEIVKIGEAAPEPSGNGPRPLSALRVLDLTRVIAGPVCARALASYGADVMHVTSPHLPDAPALVMDTGLGKLSTSLDLRRPGDADTLRHLIAASDVFCQSYRPGALAGYGFSPEELARMRPGIVYVTLSAYGATGPWRERRGFETLIQSVSRMAHEHGLIAGVDAPQHLPAQVVDHGTGYLAALGALMALVRRANDGGSYLVRVSLAQTALWIDRLGRVDGRAAPDPTVEDVADLMTEIDTPFGRLRHVVPAARLSETPAFWARPSVPLGTDPPEWPA